MPRLTLASTAGILRTLVAGAAKRLKANGRLFLVCQAYVPVGHLLTRRAHALRDARVSYDDGRFTVWTATRAARRAKPSARPQQCEARARAQPQAGPARKRDRKRAAAAVTADARPTKVPRRDRK